MKFQTIKNNYFDNINDIRISDNNKDLDIIYGGNLDLYWMITDNNIKDSEKEASLITMEITKENYGVYSQFEMLYQNIKNINLFDNDLMTEEDKDTFRMYNNANYNSLFQNDTITWYSDETNDEVANYVIIKKEIDKFILSFYTQPYLHGFDYDTHHYKTITIRFRNSGSRYDPFNILFMKMFHSLQKVDDVNDIGHQIHIEEMLYENQKKLTKRKTFE